MRLAGMPCAEPEVARDVVGAELLVALVDGRPDALGIEAERPGRELVGHLHRARLEVVAEREVAHHLEERHVALGRADHVDVDGAEAALHRRQARTGRRAPRRGRSGLNGCMPAVVSSTDWSSAEGTSEAEGTARWPRSTKNSVKRAADLVGSRDGAHESPILGVARVSGCAAPKTAQNRPHARVTLLPMAEL